MDFEQFRKEAKAEIFDFQLLNQYLGGLKKPRDEVLSLIADNKIVRLKQGFLASIL